jgi:proline racemase
VRASEYYTAVDSHTEGRPTRVITAGLGPIAGDSKLERHPYFEKTGGGDRTYGETHGLAAVRLRVS